MFEDSPKHGTGDATYGTFTATNDGIPEGAR